MSDAEAHLLTRLGAGGVRNLIATEARGGGLMESEAKAEEEGERQEEEGRAHGELIDHAKELHEEFGWSVDDLVQTIKAVIHD